MGIVGSGSPLSGCCLAQPYKDAAKVLLDATIVIMHTACRKKKETVVGSP